MTKPEREYLERRLEYALGPGYVIDSSNGGYRVETAGFTRIVSPRLTGMGIKLFIEGMAATKDEQAMQSALVLQAAREVCHTVPGHVARNTAAQLRVVIRELSQTRNTSDTDL